MTVHCSACASQSHDVTTPPSPPSGPCIRFRPGMNAQEMADSIESKSLEGHVHKMFRRFDRECVAQLPIELGLAGTQQAVLLQVLLHFEIVLQP